MIKMHHVTMELLWQLQNLLKPLWGRFDLGPPDNIEIFNIFSSNKIVCKIEWTTLQKHIEVYVDVYKYPVMITIDEDFILKVAALKGIFLDVNEARDCMLRLGETK